MTEQTSGSVTKIKIGNNLYDISVQGKALSGIDVEGSGNVIANIKYNETTNRLTLVMTTVESKLVLSADDPECLELR